MAVSNIRVDIDLWQPTIQHGTSIRRMNGKCSMNQTFVSEAIDESKSAVSDSKAYLQIFIDTI